MLTHKELLIGQPLWQQSFLLVGLSPSTTHMYTVVMQPPATLRVYAPPPAHNRKVILQIGSLSQTMPARLQRKPTTKEKGEGTENATLRY